MTRERRQAFLAITAATMAVTLALLLTHRDVLRDAPPPHDDVTAMARWLAAHPADWLVAGEISDAALDTTLPRRIELWHWAHDAAKYLAPRRPNSAASFVRAGLFHWYELGASDRKLVLDEAAPLLHDQEIFDSLARPLWELTHDLTYLRRVAPHTASALVNLRELAVVNGRFADYRELREDIRRERLQRFEATQAGLSAPDLVDFVFPPLDAGDEPLVRRIIEEVARRPFMPNHVEGRASEVADYAVRHHLGPLTGFEPLIDAERVIYDPLRARIALALGRPDAAARIELAAGVAGAPEWVPYLLDRARYQAAHGNEADANAALERAAAVAVTLPVLAVTEELAVRREDTDAAKRVHEQLVALAAQPRVWTGGCGTNEVCNSAFADVYADEAPIAIRIDTVQSDEVPPYVEVYADDALTAEGEIREPRTFTLDLPAGVHRIEVREVNKRTRNGVQRRVRVD
ncbi:MAG: hypothetical protein JO197_03855 [Acidobacteria bacterium]|nr:hypothetical protein [Acidobacteriota bacterium]MBV9071333.1 hypothetical protein [Acidobacteriota bacterium]MBV9476479.1 hypothetical protein [Acidobacteriota bacterium]